MTFHHLKKTVKSQGDSIEKLYFHVLIRMRLMGNKEVITTKKTFIKKF